MFLLFWGAIILICYSYFIYPVLLNFLVKFQNKKQRELTYYFPQVSVLIAAYNEDAILERKIISILSGNYPLENLEIIVCSDASDDQTLTILEALALKTPALTVLHNEKRSGKSFTINKLVAHASHEILLLTDANIIFNEDTIIENVKHFQNTKIGLVASLVTNEDLNNTNIAEQESAYISWENWVKYNEGLLEGCTIAPFGACFAIKKELYVPVPNHYLVDDFFIATQILHQKQCILEPKSICKEYINDSVFVEFKRRKRIAAGNFQNLVHFFKFYTNINTIAFCFWSHKGLRWFSPIFLIIILLTNLYLRTEGSLYELTLWIQAFFYCTPLTDYTLSKSKLPVKIIKFTSYFMLMNVALFLGLLHFLSGIKIGYWTSTRRK